MTQNQGNDMKGTRPDPQVDDPSKDVVATAGQQDGGVGNQQSGQQQGNMQSGQQGGQQSSQRQDSQQSGQQQGNQQSGQQGGGQHASGGTPALDDLDGQKQGESAQDASQAFQQDKQGNRQ